MASSTDPSVVISTLRSFNEIIRGKNILMAFHSPCTDGGLGGAIFSLHHGRMPEEEKGTLQRVGHYHGYTFEQEWVEAGIDMSKIQLLLFVDVAPTFEEGEALLKAGYEVVIVDHHEGMVEGLAKLLALNHPSLHTVYSPTDSGASLAWILSHEDCYTQEWTENRFMQCPPLVRIVRARDLWVFDQDEGIPNIKELAEALYATTPTSVEALQDRLLQAEDDLLQELRNGQKIVPAVLDLYCEKLSKEIRRTSFKNKAFDSSGLTAYIGCCPHFLTSVFGDWLTSHGFDDVDFYVLWAKNEATGWYGTSLRAPSTSEIELDKIAQEIAEVHGGRGGGHQRAAGVRLPTGVSWEDVFK